MNRRTLVVDGVPDGEDAENGGEEGQARRVLAVEVTLLDTTHSGRGRGALGEARVEVDERDEAGALARRLRRNIVRKKPG